jgi:hypothetical protein|tara:strand:+ start:421 stop:678 length:258 start_codon:yes stop_codon:yes gene_type:complete
MVKVAAMVKVAELAVVDLAVELILVVVDLAVELILVVVVDLAVELIPVEEGQLPEQGCLNTKKEVIPAGLVVGIARFAILIGLPQ